MIVLTLFMLFFIFVPIYFTIDIWKKILDKEEKDGEKFRE